MRRPALLALLAVSLLACGGGLPEPRYTKHDGETPQVVPSMPPPGKVEIVPPRPATLKHPVWIDGEWEWTGRRWTWKEPGKDPGKAPGWVDAPPDAAYALPLTLRLPDGRLVHFPGGWKKDKPPPP